MVSTIRYSANASSDHHPNQVPGILIIMNPKQRDRRKFCVIDVPRQYENLRLSQE